MKIQFAIMSMQFEQLQLQLTDSNNKGNQARYEVNNLK